MTEAHLPSFDARPGGGAAWFRHLGWGHLAFPELAKVFEVTASRFSFRYVSC